MHADVWALYIIHVLCLQLSSKCIKNKLDWRIVRKDGCIGDCVTTQILCNRNRILVVGIFIVQFFKSFNFAVFEKFYNKMIKENKIQKMSKKPCHKISRLFFFQALSIYCFSQSSTFLFPPSFCNPQTIINMCMYFNFKARRNWISGKRNHILRTSYMPKFLFVF